MPWFPIDIMHLESDALLLPQIPAVHVPKHSYETKGESPYYSWTTTGHTPTDVYCFINGADIAFESYSSFNDKYRIKNTDIFKIIQALFGYTPTV